MKTSITAPPIVVIEELSETQCSFSFNKQLAELFMEAILTDFPEAHFYVAEPEDMSNN